MKCLTSRVVLPLLLSALAAGQSLHFAGGESTLLNATGGGLTAYLPGQELYLGGGKGLGFSDKVKWKGREWTFGDSNFSYSVDGAGISIFNRGVKVEKKTNEEVLGMFVGFTGFSYQVPFFASMYEARKPGVGFYYKRQVRKWKFQSLDLFSRQKTLMQSASYNGAKVGFYVNGGLIENIFQSGANFAFRPSRSFSASASHTNQKSFESDSAYLNWQPNWFMAHASFIDDAFAGKRSTGESLGIGERWRRLQARSDFYRTGNKDQIVNSVIQTLQHWSFTEAVSNKNQFQFGAGYSSNTFAVSVNHEIAFLPGEGFQQVLSVEIQLKIRDTSLNGMGYLFDRKFRWTGNGDQWLQGPIAVEGHAMHRSIGKFVQTGVVKRKDGQPVEGAAVEVGSEIVYTDQQGVWTFRSKKKSMPPAELALDQFLCPGKWKLSSATEGVFVVEQID